MSREGASNNLACEVVETQVEEHDEDGYLYRRLGEIAFQTAQQSDPSQPGSQQCLVAAGTFGLTAFCDQQGGKLMFTRQPALQNQNSMT